MAKLFLERLAELLETRRLIAVMFSIVAVVLWYKGAVDLKDELLMILTFYFATTAALKKPGEDRD